MPDGTLVTTPVLPDPARRTVSWKLPPAAFAQPMASPNDSAMQATNDANPARRDGDMITMLAVRDAPAIDTGQTFT
jgi:hypothetical protein